MNRALHLWPGGIPFSVRIQPERDMSDAQVEEESKAWLLFVSVSLFVPLFQITVKLIMK
jgi:hypothetical protein